MSLEIIVFNPPLMSQYTVTTSKWWGWRVEMYKGLKYWKINNKNSGKKKITKWKTSVKLVMSYGKSRLKGNKNNKGGKNWSILYK